MTNHTTLRTIWLALACLAATDSLHAMSTCQFGSKALSFGNYFASDSTPHDRAGSINVSCTDTANGAGVTAILDVGSSAYGAYNNRKMASGPNYLSYGIYTDPTHNNILGGINKLTLFTGPLAAGVAKQMTFNLYGRIPPQQNVPIGLYSDAVVITVTP